MKYNNNGEIKEINVKISDTLPIGSIIEYSGDTVPEGYEGVGPSVDYISVGLNDDTKISKDIWYSGVDIPFSKVKYQRGNSDFNLVNNKVYYDGVKRALIQVNYNVASTIQGYIIAGGTNGSYSIIIDSNSNDLAGYSANGSSLIIIEPGDYVTCMIGKTSTFTDETVYYNTKLDAYVLTYLE